MKEQIKFEYSYTIVTRKFENMTVVAGSTISIEYDNEDERKTLVKAHKDRIKAEFEIELAEAVEEVKAIRNG